VERDEEVDAAGGAEISLLSLETISRDVEAV